MVREGGGVIEEEGIECFVGVVVFPVFDDFGSQILCQLVYERHSNDSIYRIINVLIPFIIDFNLCTKTHFS